jgi:hypothetical protein
MGWMAERIVAWHGRDFNGLQLVDSWKREVCGNGWTCSQLWLLHNNSVRWHCAHLKDVSAVINYIRQPLEDVETRITFVSFFLAQNEKLFEINERLYFEMTLSVTTSFSQYTFICFRSETELVEDCSGKLKMWTAVVIDIACCVIRDVCRIEEIDFESIYRAYTKEWCGFNSVHY